ncbi:MAG: flagellar hook-associated protein FlgL [Polyangiaceae bacterium]
MRVSEGLKYGMVSRNLARLSAEHADASQKALSGSRVARPSDDPVAAAELIRNRSAQARVEARRGTVRNTLGDTELAENALAEASDLFVRAKELAMQGANGSLSADERSSLAEGVRALREQLVTLGNSQGARGYLFAGSQTSTQPFDAAGTFSGDDADLEVDLGAGGPTVIDLAGAEAFTVAGGRDVFADLTALETALASNNQTAVAATLDGLDAAHEQLVQARSKVGLLGDKLRTSDALLEQLNVGLAQQDQRVSQADPFESYSRMMTLGQTLEQAVTVSRQILDLSALNRF